MKIIIALFALLTSVSAFAEDSSTGCGLGWKVTSSMSFSATTTRGTTNSYTQPFGMTFGTAGCSKHTIVKNDVQIKNFVNTSYDSLSLDVAVGSGEHLTALANLLGCSSSSAVGVKMKSNYKTLFPANGSTDQFINDVQNMIGNDAQLSQSCQVNS